MRVAALLSTILLCCLSASAASGKQAGPIETFLTSGAFERARAAYPTCNWKEDFVGCRELVLIVIAGHVGRQEYAIASKYIKDMYKGVTADGIRTPSACPSDTVHLNGKFYSVEYFPIVYMIYDGLKSKEAKNYALKAFLCTSWYTNNYKVTYYTDSHIFFSRKAFIHYFARENNEQAKFDVQLYLDDVLANVASVRTAINKNGGSKAASLKEIALYKNAARRCDELGLDAGFGKFFRELAAEHMYYAK